MQLLSYITAERRKLGSGNKFENNPSLAALEAGQGQSSHILSNAEATFVQSTRTQ